MKTKLTYTALTLLASLSLVYCAANNDTDTTGNGTDAGPTTTTENGSGGSGTGGDSAGGENAGGDTSGGGINFGTGGGNGGEGGACVDLVVEGESQLKPADIIFVIDNSGSMSEEINGVEQNISVNFAQVMAASSIDYRIIMVTDHGTGSYDVCIGPPLSGTTNCSGAPVNIPGQFYHYSVNVQSHDSFCKVLNTFYGTEADQYNLAPGGWQQWLRPEAIKVFVEVSDDGASCTWDGTNMNDSDSVTAGQSAAVAFDQKLLALSPLHFGTQAARNYQWYSLVGLGPKNPGMPLEPWNEFDPVTTQKCTPGSVAPGTAYQWLSKGTKALRFPLCDPSGYNVLFQDIAAGVEEGTKVACELIIPEPPMGQELDLNTLTVVYTPGGNGTPIELSKVDNVSQCGADNFYIEDDLIKICPTSCTTFEGDPNAKVEIKLQCGGIAD